ncbi:MAG: thioredoxin family protein [Candidatus Binatia bacterium]
MRKSTIEILTATGCSKCLKAHQTIKKVISEFGNQIDYHEVNITEQPEKLAQYGVISTPCVVIDGRLVFEGLPKEADLRGEIIHQLRGDGSQITSDPVIISWTTVVLLTASLGAIFAFAWYGFQAWVPVVLKSLENVQQFSTPLLFSYAFFAGLLTFAAPCAIGILPAYLTFYLNLKEEKESTQMQKLKKGVRFGTIAGLGAALSYIPILGILYAIPSLVLGARIGFSTTASYLVLSAWSKPIIIAILIIFGVILVTNYSFSTNRLFLFIKERLGVRGNPKESVFGFGLLYGVGSYGCGMLVVVPLVVFNLLNGIVLKSLISFIVYLAGFFFMVFLITTLVSLSKGEGLQKFITYAPWFKRGAGLVILLATAWLINFYIKTGGM